MSLSTSDLARLRRMIGDTAATPEYSDAVLDGMATPYSLDDVNGVAPGEDDWIPTYDLNGVAADVWEEKANAKWDEFDVVQLGGSFSRRQKFDNAMQQSRYYRSRTHARSRTIAEANAK